MIYKESISLSSQKRFTRNIFNAWKFTRDKCTPGTCMHNFLDKNNKVIYYRVTEMHTRNFEKTVNRMLKANLGNSKECRIEIFSRGWIL